MPARKLLLTALFSTFILSGWALKSAVFESSPLHAEIKMSKSDPAAMRAKSKELNAKSRERNLAATERMRQILLEKRQGKRGFSKNFNTLPGDKKR